MVAVDRPPFVCVSVSGKKQSFICQHNHKQLPTPTNVNINDVNALITISVLFVGSFDVTTIGGGQRPLSSIQYGGGQLFIPSFSNAFEMHVLS